MTTKPTRYKSPKKSIPWMICIVLALLPVIGVITLFLRLHTLVPLLVMVFSSLLAYYFYWQDKRRAQRNEWRIPEANLHFWALIGGWPGAFVAQQQFRHKTKKLSFLWFFWLIVLSHQVLWFDWLFMDGKWLVSVLG
jgi:uncharacterized membrane protein YsdA (DUF1294 family)